jgi:hypothetical protein
VLSHNSNAFFILYTHTDPTAQRCYLTTQRLGLLNDPTTPTAVIGIVVAVQVGNASILAWNITDSRLSKDANGNNHLTMNGGDYDNENGGSSPVTQVTTYLLLKLASMAAKEDTVPWCLQRLGAAIKTDL